MRNYKSYFWPILLIGAGVMLLLSNMGLIEMASLFQLLNLWPLILVGVGINLMFGRNNDWVGLAVSLTMITLAVLFLLYAPQLDLPGRYTSKDFVTENFSESVGQAESYKIDFDGLAGDVTVTDGASNGNLVMVEMYHNLESTFDVSGTTHKNISIGLGTENDFWTTPSNWFNFNNWEDSKNTYVDMQLDSSIPADLRFEITSGNMELLLEEFELTNFNALQTSGTSNVYLPSGDYPSNFDTTSGIMNVTLSDDMDLDLDAEMTSGDMTFLFGDDNVGNAYFDMTSGDITLNLPEGLEVQVIVDSTSGSMRFSNEFIRVSGNEELVGEEGTWETDGYDSTENGLQIVIEMTSGDLRVNITD